MNKLANLIDINIAILTYLFKTNLTGSFGRDFQFYYCTRSAHAVSSVKKWPKGNYCVLRHGGSCPSGEQKLST